MEEWEAYETVARESWPEWGKLTSEQRQELSRLWEGIMDGALMDYEYYIRKIIGD